jgi:acetyltransferase-like isoleucine patch superfamily enzyme
MRRWIYNIISVVYSLIKFSVIKFFHWRTFDFHFIERFSPGTSVRFVGNGRIKFEKYITAHNGARFRAINKGHLIIGENSRFNYNCIVVARNYIRIGKGVGFGPNVMIFDHDHDYKAKEGFKRKFINGKIIIGDNCWIGANTVILKNTILGSNCVVAAGSVISGSYPDNTLIVQKRETQQKSIIIE